MIISASRRTDIPALYSAWMLARLRAGEVLVPQVRNAHRVTRVPLTPEDVDCIVFWTKNPEPMLPTLATLDAMGYMYYFSVSITAFDRDVEPGLPPKARVVEAFKRLSAHVGPERVDWRFDPVVIKPDMPLAFHLERFDALCRALHGTTTRCILSFADPYRHLRGTVAPVSAETMRVASAGFAAVARAYGLPLYACAEAEDLSAQGVARASCIDARKIERLLGHPLRVPKDANQRPGCGCCASVDIGVYNTCTHGCAYCYATFSAKTAAQNLAQHVPDSPMLTGHPAPQAQIVALTPGKRRGTSNTGTKG